MGRCRHSDWRRLLALLPFRVLNPPCLVRNSSLNMFQGVSPLAAAVVPGLPLTAALVGPVDVRPQTMDLRNTMDNTTDLSRTTVGTSLHLKLQPPHTRLRIKATMVILVAIRVISEANKLGSSFNHRRTLISRNEAVMLCMSPHRALRRRSEETRLFGRLRPTLGSLGYEA